MATYWKDGAFRDLDPALVAAWQAAGNPKAEGLVLVPEPPSYDPLTQTLSFEGADWVVGERTPEAILAAKAAIRSGMSCSRAQGKLALLQSDLLATVEAWVAEQSQAAQIEYIDRGEWRRTWPLIEEARVALGLTDAQIDDLFTLAATL